MIEVEMLRREFNDVMRSINESQRAVARGRAERSRLASMVPTEQIEFAKSIAPAVIKAHAEYSAPTRLTDEDVAESIATITGAVFQLLGKKD